MIPLRRAAASLLNAGLLLACVAGTVHAQRERANQPAAGEVRYEENRGQIVDAEKHACPDILYTTQSHGVTAYLRTTGLSYVFVQSDGVPPGSADRQRREPFALGMDTSVHVTTYRMDMALVGANPNVRVESQFPSQGYANFYLAQCPNGITNVRSFGRVIYHDIYPKIDLVYYGSGGRMKYDFVVHPGGRVSDIVMRYIGAGELRYTESGTVKVSNPLGTIEEGHPKIYQGSSGQERHVNGTYATMGEEVRFSVGAYDESRDLVIDPTLIWSTYLGGTREDILNSQTSGAASEVWTSSLCRADHDTTITVLGTSKSKDFPTTPGVVQRTLYDMTNAVTAGDAVVARFSHRGNLLWATYFGGDGTDVPTSVALDNMRDAFIAIDTRSANLPTTPGAYQKTSRSNALQSAVLELDPQGRLAWCTYYGGTWLFDIAVDRASNVIVVGLCDATVTMTGTPFSTPPPKGDTLTGLITKFDRNGSRRIWSGFLGGTSCSLNWFTYLTGITVDSSGNLYVCGSTSCSDFPVTADAYQTNLRGESDVFIGKYDSGGARLWCTYYGGTGWDYANDIAVDRRGNPVVVGETGSADLPVSADAFQKTLATRDEDAFIVRFNASGNYLWGTYYGGSRSDIATGVDIDAAFNVWVLMWVTSSDFPVTADAFQPHSGGGNDPYDAGIVKLDSAGRQRWASYLGGTSHERAGGISVNPFGCVVAGSTLSVDFPTTAGAYQPTNHGVSDLFVTAFCDPAVVVAAEKSVRLCQGDSIVLSAPPGFDRYQWNTGATTPSIVTGKGGVYFVTLISPGGCVANSAAITVTIVPTPKRTLHIDRLPRCSGDSVTLSVDGGILSYRWNTGDTSQTLVVPSSGRYSLTFVDTNGCTGYSNAVDIVLHQPIALTLAPSEPTTICAGDSLTLTATASVPVTYRWSTGETGRSIIARAGGLYTVIVADANGCSDTASVRVDVLPEPHPLIHADGTFRFCEGDSVILSASGYSAYAWSTGSRDSSIVVRAAGMYSLAVMTAAGCSGRSDTVAVIVDRSPVVSISGPLTVCHGAQAQYTAVSDSTVTYTWQVSGGTIVGGQGSSDATVVWGSNGTGTVQVVASGSASGCTGSSSVSVSIGSQLEPIITPGGPIQRCAGDSIILDAGPGYASYLWSSGETSRSIAVKTSGAYNVKVTNSDGCEGTSGDVIVTVHPLPAKPVIGITGSTLTSTPANAYQWSLDGVAIAGGTSQSEEATASGLYRVTITDANGCMSTSDPA
ncbi:MAG TPA: SBBP repeat-containing protein, partial [Candidatus Kapabacteria bacterium]|nr:SBBP repeat-containing protein [Candidatus Kapabacteria bacterium]